MNLMIFLGVAGLSHSLFGKRLIPIGTVYDTFISRGLDALNYACYQDSRFILIGTPSGITLATEGGAHQSISTPLIGMSQDGLASFEPAFADELAIILEWSFDYLQRSGKNKIDKTKANGAEVVLYKRHIESREEIAIKISEEKNYPLVKPFDNEDIIAGQGSFGLEACEYFITNNIKPDIVLSCTSGGGLVAGTSIAFKHYFPNVDIYPVEPATCNDTEISLQNKTRTRIKHERKTICDALEVEIPGQITFPINLVNCKSGLSVTDEEVCFAMKYLYEEFNVKAEPSGCVSLAAVLSKKIDVKNKTVLVTISGGNVDDDSFEKYIDLTKN